ncbi:hypothetical protein SLA2020_387690 [Shorea laevis]
MKFWGRPCDDDNDGEGRRRRRAATWVERTAASSWASAEREAKGVGRRACGTSGRLASPPESLRDLAAARSASSTPRSFRKLDARSFRLSFRRSTNSTPPSVPPTS